MTQSKIELLLSLKNRMKTGLSEAKDRLNNSIKEMKGKLNSLKAHHIEAFSAIRDQVPGLGRAVELLQNPYVLVTAAVIALAAAFYKCTEAAAEFNTEFVGLQNLNLDKSKEEIAQLRTDILDAAFDTGVAAKDMLGAYADIQGGLDIYGKEVDTIARKVAEFSIGTQSGLADNINSTVKAMQAFGFGAEKVEEYLASNAKAVNVGIASFAELAQIQTEFAGAAAAAGQDFNVANKLFAAFSQSSKNAGIAATMTRSAFAGLTAKPTIDGLKSIGISMTDARGKMKSLETVLRELNPKLKKMSDERFLRFRNAIGGPEGLQNLFNQMRTSGDKLLETFDGFDRSEFSIVDALKNAKGDLNTMKEIMGNQVNNIMIRIGYSIMPAILEAFGFILDAGMELFSELRNIYNESELLQDIFSVIGTILKAVIIIPIAQLYAFVKYILLTLQLWTKTLEPIWKLIKNIGAGFWELIKAAGSALMNFIDPLWKKLMEWKEGLKSFFSDLWSNIKTSINNVVDTIVTGIKNMVEHLRKIPLVRDVVDRFMVGYKRSTSDENLDLTPESSGGGSNTPKGGGSSGGDGGISKVAGESKHVRNMTVNIEALHKGDNKVHSEKSSSMSVQELERMMNELLLRTIRNVEGSY